MKTVILSAAPREYYRQKLVSEEELYCSPAVGAGGGVNGEKTWRAPSGVYDVPAFLKALPEKWQKPDLLVVHFDVGLNVVPRNVGGVSCPKVLMVGDTHHLARPIRKFLEYAWSEPYDAVVGEFNRQHLHFFKEAGLANGRVGWIPCFTLCPFEEFATIQRSRGATFVGQAGNYHPYRRWVLEEARKLGGPIQSYSGSQRDTARVHGESVVSVNISLNGDLNLRTFEVMAAGGFLVADRLSPESGLSLVFEEGKHLELFGEVGELVEKVKYFLGKPEEALARARAGHEHYMKVHRPERKVEALMNLVGGKEMGFLDVGLDKRAGLAAEGREQLMKRIAVYEQLQEFQRTNVRVEALFWPGAARHVVDAVDLVRVNRWVLEEGYEESMIAKAGFGDRVQRASREKVEGAGWRWGVVVCGMGDLADAGFQKLLERRGCDLVTVVDGGADEVMGRLGWRRWSGDPVSYVRSPA